MFQLSAPKGWSQDWNPKGWPQSLCTQRGISSRGGAGTGLQGPWTAGGAWLALAGAHCPDRQILWTIHVERKLLMLGSPSEDIKKNFKGQLTITISQKER